MLSDADVLAKTGSENVETTVRKRRILVAGLAFVWITRGSQNE